MSAATNLKRYGKIVATQNTRRAYYESAPSRIGRPFLLLSVQITDTPCIWTEIFYFIIGQIRPI